MPSFTPRLACSGQPFGAWGLEKRVPLLFTGWCDEPKEENAITYSMQLPLLLTTLLTTQLPADDTTGAPAPVQPPLDDYLQPAWQQLLDRAAQFRSAAVSPAATRAFEQQLQLQVREIARLTAQ